jgi:Ni/Co efflux regulator RcnB
LTFPEPDKESKKMKFLRQILLMAMVVIGFSLTASAQRRPDDERKKPPKNNAEIKPEEKKPPRNNDNRNNDNRNNDNRGKKPQAFFLISENRIEITSI